MLRFILASFLFVLPTFSTTLSQPDEYTVTQIIHEEIPELRIDSLTLISTGWDNLVADVNGQWIFRFPRNPAFLTILEREVKLLNRLHQHVTLPIPYYHFIGKHTDFVGYQKIQGIPLDDAIYSSLSETQKDHLAGTLAQFISELHTSVTIKEAREWGYKDYTVSRCWIECDLLGTVPEEIDALIQEALNIPQKDPEYVLIHNDLHGDNLAVDPLSYQINGIFDFSDAVVADYTVEFGKLFNIHPDLAVRTGKIYADANHVADPTPYAAIDFILRRSVYILHAREAGDQKREAILIKMLKDFIPVWNELNLSKQCKNNNYISEPQRCFNKNICDKDLFKLSNSANY